MTSAKSMFWLCVMALSIVVLTTVGVAFGPGVILAILGAAALAITPIAVSIIQQLPKTAIESAPKVEQQRELDPNDFDSRVDWLYINAQERELGWTLSEHPDKCVCTECQYKDPMKRISSSSSIYVPLNYVVTQKNGTNESFKTYSEAWHASLPGSSVVLPEDMSVTPIKDNKCSNDDCYRTQKFGLPMCADHWEEFRTTDQYKALSVPAKDEDYRAGRICLKINYNDGTNETIYLLNIETARNEVKRLKKDKTVVSTSIISADNARSQVEKADILSRYGIHYLCITYKDGTRQSSTYDTYELAKRQMDHVTAYSTYSLPGLDVPKDQHATSDSCSCVACNPTFGITPAENCIRNSCTCRYCDPDTTAPILMCKVTGKPARMYVSVELPVLETYKDANIGSLIRAVISGELTERQYYKLAKKHFDGDKSQARFVLSSALNDHHQKIAEALISPAPQFKIGDWVTPTQTIPSRSKPNATSSMVVGPGYHIKVTEVGKDWVKGTKYFYDTVCLELVKAAPKAISAPKFSIGDKVEANRGVVTLRSCDTHGERQREVMLGTTFEVKALSRGGNWFTPTPTGDSVWYFSAHFDKVKPEPANNFEMTRGLP